MSEQGINLAAAIELRGVLNARIQSPAAFDPVPAGKLIDPEQVAGVEVQALSILIGKGADLGLVRARDDLRDRLEGLRSPGLDVDERIAVFEARGRHEACDVVLAGLHVVGDAGVRRDLHGGDIGPQRRKRREHLTEGIDDGAAPAGLARSARVGARYAAQQAVVHGLDGRIGIRERTEIAGCGRRGDGVERCARPAQAREVGSKSELAAEHRVSDCVIVVDHRMHDRNGFLVVDAGKAIEVHRAHVEIAAVAATAEIGLREHIIRRGSQQVSSLNTAIEPVILKIRTV